MSNHSFSLKEFVEPLPICQAETDLGNIMSIFQHSNCKMLAIDQGKLGWGVINSEDLLSLVTEVWLGDSLSVTSHPRNFMHQQRTSCRLIPEVKTLIKPAMVYQAETKLNEFFSRLKYSWLREERVCLIVNHQGELLGKLDKDKIIKYLVSKPFSPENSQLSPSLHYLTSLLEAIALPSKIETAEGQVIYTNQLWQQLIAENQDAASRSPSASSQVELKEMTKWLIDRQRASLAPHPQGDNRASDPQSDLTKELKFREDSLSLDTRRSSWNYLKIPLISDREAVSFRTPLGYPKSNRQQTAAGESHNSPHNLVLATPQIQSPATTNNSTSTSEVSANQLLATVSHELKSPLTGIVGLTSLLQGQKLGTLNQRQTRYVELIYRSGKKMMSVVDDLLQLTALTSEQPKDLELINLESLCRQLYRAVLTKVHSIEGRLNSTIDLAQPKLSIELGSEMAIPSRSRSVIANKSVLSSVLSHLILEAIAAGETIEPLKIQIKSLSKVTAIIITGQPISATVNPGLNLMIAKCLSEILEARVSHACSTTSCQFTLLLPNQNTQSSHQTDTVASNAANPSTTANLTILCLYPELEVIDPQASHNHSLNFDLKSWSDSYEKQTGYQHRIIEADSLEQAHNLARIWQLDAIILNGHQISQPNLYLRSLQESEHLATLPLITLDTRITEAANQIEGLNVYPCLLPAQQCNIADLIQVIQIAIKS
jgi:signal transduction histidine kinase